MEPYGCRCIRLRGLPLCTFNNSFVNDEAKIDTVSGPLMCRCSTFADLLSVIPEYLQGSEQDVMRLISESSQREEPAEIMLDVDADESLCCQHFLEFMENYLFPEFLKNREDVPQMSEEEYNKERKRVEEGMSDWLGRMNATNCQDLFSEEWELELRKKIQEGDPFQIEIAEKRIKTSVHWWIYELEKCITGDDFDFSDHQEM